MFLESIYSLPRWVFSARSNLSETSKQLKMRTTSERDSTSEVSVTASQTASERTTRVRGTDTARIDVRVSMSGNESERKECALCWWQVQGRLARMGLTAKATETVADAIPVALDYVLTRMDLPPLDETAAACLHVVLQKVCALCYLQLADIWLLMRLAICS